MVTLEDRNESKMEIDNGEEFFKSLDHRSFTFKQMDRKESNARVYVSDTAEKYKHLFYADDVSQFDGEGQKLYVREQRKIVEDFVNFSHSTEKKIYLLSKIEMADLYIHRDLKRILLHCAKKACSVPSKDSHANIQSIHRPF